MLGTEGHLNKHFQNQSDVVHYLRHILDAASLDLNFNIESQQAPSTRWVIRFNGTDVDMLTADDGRLLTALGHLVAESFGFSELHSEVSSIVLGGTRWPAAGRPTA
jgi:predicted RNA-binding protein Jag